MTAKVKTSASIKRPETGARRRLSRPLIGLDVAALAAGLISGLIAYLHRSPVRVAHVPGTSAWPEQLAVAALAVAALGVGWLSQRTGKGDGRAWRWLLAPFGPTAFRRLTLTVGAAGSSASGAARALLALPPAVLFLYCFWRAGHQVTAGLDPNSTANAWGGPGYAGALACHCLDTLVLAALAAALLSFILPRESNSPDQAGQPVTVGGRG